MYFFRILLLSLVLLTGFMPAHAQLTVSAGQTAATLVAALSGGGVTITNATLTCPSVANGTFSYTGATLGISNGILLTTGHADGAAGAEPPLVDFRNGTPGDPDMAPLFPTGTALFDACVLEFDLTPSGDTVSFNYQFGSEEYRQAVCTYYNDAFAFFISGPGIVGTQNMALVPGTTTPVMVNSINNGVVGTAPGANIANCTSLGVGSPYTSYYLDNAGGTLLAYRGFTAKLRATHAVTPCATYHLKMSIVDGGDNQQDSGVFLEKGSLTSNTFRFSTTDSVGVTINGQQHTIVKGCNGTTIKIIADHASPVPETINLAFSGTAVMGTDVNSLSASVILPAGSTTVSFNVQGLLTPLAGEKDLTVYIRSACGYYDYMTLHILDTAVLQITTPDTAVCSGQPFIIRTAGSAGLSYSWSPATGLNDPTLAQPTAAPLVATVYTVSANFAGAGCTALVRTIKVDMNAFAFNVQFADSVFCTGTNYTFDLGDTKGVEIYWSFVAGDTLKNINAIAHAWDAAGLFSVAVGPLYSGCGNAVIKAVRVYTSPYIYLGNDTSLCAGNGTILLTNQAATLPGTSWLWNTGSTTPAITVVEPATYYVTALTNGCTASDTIVIANDCYVDIPNVFTPNGDGVNDYFFPRQLLTKGLATFSMHIYNRWGQDVFSSQSLTGAGWDGSYGGEPQAQGVYVYVIAATFKDGQIYNRHGNLTLLK